MSLLPSARGRDHSSTAIWQHIWTVHRTGQYSDVLYTMWHNEEIYDLRFWIQLFYDMDNLLCFLGFKVFYSKTIYYLKFSVIHILIFSFTHFSEYIYISNGYFSTISLCCSIVSQYKQSLLQCCCSIDIMDYNQKYCDVWFCCSFSAVIKSFAEKYCDTVSTNIMKCPIKLF